MRRWLIVSLLLVSTGALAFGDGPEISRSRGKKDGIVVLWPRVIAEAGVGNAEAARVQASLAAIARLLVPESSVDVRPEPERACPREGGCRAMALGAVIAMKAEGCAVVATVSLPGTTPATLVPWVGEVGFKSKKMAVPFREPPEAEMFVSDFAPCADLATALEAGSARVADVLKATTGGAPVASER